MAVDAVASAKAGNAKSLHITLGFLEAFTRAESRAGNEINLAAIEQFAQRYRDILLVAFDRAKYVFYVEAHIPQISHGINAAAGAYEKAAPASPYRYTNAQRSNRPVPESFRFWKSDVTLCRSDSGNDQCGI